MSLVERGIAHSDWFIMHKYCYLNILNCLRMNIFNYVCILHVYITTRFAIYWGTMLQFGPLTRITVLMFLDRGWQNLICSLIQKCFINVCFKRLCKINCKQLYLQLKISLWISFRKKEQTVQRKYFDKSLHSGVRLVLKGRDCSTALQNSASALYRI